MTANEQNLPIVTVGNDLNPHHIVGEVEVHLGSEYEDPVPSYLALTLECGSEETSVIFPMPRGMVTNGRLPDDPP